MTLPKALVAVRLIFLLTVAVFREALRTVVLRFVREDALFFALLALALVVALLLAALRLELPLAERFLLVLLPVFLAAAVFPRVLLLFLRLLLELPRAGPFFILPPINLGLKFPLLVRAETLMF